jgi:hypothetical protein
VEDDLPFNSHSFFQPRRPIGGIRQNLTGIPGSGSGHRFNYPN